MKKIILVSVFFLLFGLSPHVSAQPCVQGQFCALAPISGLTDQDSTRNATSVVSSSSFASFFNNLYKYCIGLSAALAVIMIIWGGLEYSTQDVPGAKQNGKERIQQAILGLVLVLSPVLVFSIINPRILNLSIGITPLGLGSFVGAPSASPQSQTRCDSGNLTPEQRQACQSVLEASQQGLVPTQEQQQVIQQTASGQSNSCTDGGGMVYRGAMLQRGNQCDPLALRQMQSNGYTVCSVLADGSACFSR